LIETQGFELTEAKQLHSFDKRYKVRISIQPKKAHYRRLSETRDEEQSIKDAFNLCVGANGKVVVKDFLRFLQQFKQHESIIEDLSKAFWNKMLSEVTYSEVQKALGGRKNGRAQTVKQKIEGISTSRRKKELDVYRTLFENYDTDKDGMLSLLEFKKGLREKFTGDTIVKMFEENDLDKDGYLTFEDFARIYLSEN
jgi:Ca2+-binding EF-hand superfamily protein